MIHASLTVISIRGINRMNVEVRPFDLFKASKKDWFRFHEFRRTLELEFLPGQKSTDEDTWDHIFKADLLDKDMIAFEAVDLEKDEKIAAFVRLFVFKESSPSFKNNEHICNLAGITVREEYRRYGIAEKLLPFVYNAVKSLGRTSLTGSLLNNAGHILNSKIGGREVLAMQDNRLSLETLDWKLMEKWIKEGQKRSPGTHIEFYHEIPDILLHEYCDVFTEVGNQAPRDELETGDLIFTPKSWKARMEELKRAGMRYLSAISLEKDGRISGLTDVTWLPFQPSVLIQNLTGVLHKYRGKGIGKWLKGAMVLKVREEFPDVIEISTQNATSNEPMLAINRQMGFKLYREVYLFQLELEKLGKYLHISG